MLLTCHLHASSVIRAPPWQSVLLVTCIWPKPVQDMVSRKVVTAASHSPDTDIPLNLPSRDGHNLWSVVLLHPIWCRVSLGDWYKML